MNWLSPTPNVGDWIRTTQPIKTSLADYLSGPDAGVKPGTPGVVLRRNGWNSLQVRLDTGLFGSVTIDRVKPSQVRVVRRGGGVVAHKVRADRLRWARAGVAFALVAPLLIFVLRYMLIEHGTKAGLITTLVVGAIQGALDLVAFAFENPPGALMYAVALSVATRFAFRA